MVRAFIDDSGSGGDNRYFVLAGYAADLPTWESFANAWKAVLDAPPAIKYFKMSEAESRKGEFLGFSERERSDKVNALIDVILGHNVFEGSCRLQFAAYEEILKPLFKDLPQWDDPYLYLAIPLVTLFASYERRYGAPQRSAASDAVVLVGGDRSIDPVDFVFDTHDKQGIRRAKRAYEQLKAHPLYQQADYIGNIDYRDDKDFLPLQAADLIAWQDRRRLCAVAEGTRVEYERLHRDKLRFHHNDIDRAGLQKQANQIRAGVAKLRAKYGTA